MLNNILFILKNGKDKVLYKINGESITYEEAYDRVLELSSDLRKQGSSSVIIYGHKSIQQFISILSCVVANRCYIPIDLCTPISRIYEIIDKTNSRLLIKNESLDIDLIEALTVDEIHDKYKDIDEERTFSNQYAYIIFTSGSTGNSKGVPITYQNLNHFIYWITNSDLLRNCKNITVLSQASFSFDLSVMDIYFSLFKKNTIIGLDDNSNESLDITLDIIKKEHINFLIMTPTFVKVLLLEDSFNSVNYKDIKYMFFCGECLEVVVARKIKMRFPDVVLINAYGPTEATCCVTLLEITDDMLDRDYLPVGDINTSACRIEIHDREIVLKGKSVFQGYLDILSDNCYKEGFVNCYKTRDLGYIENGLLYCSGRLDNQVKYQGYRIELGDIENNLLKIKGIREAVVVAKYKENTHLVKLLKAYVVLDEDITVENIKSRLCELLPIYMIPKVIEIIDSIPVNQNGKYDRKRLS